MIDDKFTLINKLYLCMLTEAGLSGLIYAPTSEEVKIFFQCLIGITTLIMLIKKNKDEKK